MTCSELFTELHTQGFTLSVEGDRLKVSPKNKLTPELARQITERKAQLIALLTPAPAMPDLSAPYWQDPRADLTEDSGLWKVVLTIARDVDEQLFGALHGMRCLGGKLSKKDGRLSLTGRKGEGWDTAEDFKADYRRWILPYKAALAEVLQKAQELPRSAFMAGLGYSINGIHEREYEEVA